MRHILFILFLLIAVPADAQNKSYQGQYTINKFAPQATPSPNFGNKFSNSYNSPQLYTNDGQYRGNLNTNRFDPNSVSNPYGRYGSKFSPDSINNPYGAGSRYKQNSPYNPYGQGLRVYE